MRLSAGDGAKEPRTYDWARVSIRPLKEPGKGYWLLVRRRVVRCPTTARSMESSLFRPVG